MTCYGVILCGVQNARMALRVREIRQGKGQTLEQVAAGVDLSVSQLSRIESGKSDTPVSTLERIAEFLRCDVGDFFAKDSKLDAPFSIIAISAKGFVQAGYWSDANELPPDEWVEFTFPKPNLPFEKYTCLVSRGTSMNRVWPDGTPLLCVDIIEYHDKGFALEDGQFVIVQRRNGNGMFEASVKQLEIVDDRYWLWPRSHDPEFQQPLELPNPTDSSFSEQQVGVEDGEVKVTGVVVTYAPQLIRNR